MIKTDNLFVCQLLADGQTPSIQVDSRQTSFRTITDKQHHLLNGPPSYKTITVYS